MRQVGQLPRITVLIFPLLCEHCPRWLWNGKFKCWLRRYVFL